MRLPSYQIAALVAGTGLPHTSLMAQADPTNWRAVAAKIVAQIAPKPGERVLLVGVPGVADPLVPLLREAVRSAGATDLGAVAERAATPAEGATDYTRELAKRGGPARVEYLRTVDAAVMMPGPTPADSVYAAMQEVLRSGHGRTVHFHWAGAYDLTGTLLPTTSDVSRVYERALLQTDYAALAAKQRALESAMRANVVHITTPLGTNLTFRIGHTREARAQSDRPRGRAAGGRCSCGAARRDRGRHDRVPADGVGWPPGPGTGPHVQARPGDGDSRDCRTRRGRARARAGWRGGAQLSRARAGAESVARRARGRASLDPVLRLRRRGHSPVTRRQLRARRHGARRVCAVEFLHRRDGEAGVGDVGRGRPTRAIVPARPDKSWLRSRRA